MQFRQTGASPTPPSGYGGNLKTTLRYDALGRLAGVDDHVVRVAPALERVGDFAAFWARRSTKP